MKKLNEKTLTCSENILHLREKRSYELFIDIVEEIVSAEQLKKIFTMHIEVLANDPKYRALHELCESYEKFSGISSSKPDSPTRD